MIKNNLGFKKKKNSDNDCSGNAAGYCSADKLYLSHKEFGSPRMSSAYASFKRQKDNIKHFLFHDDEIGVKICIPNQKSSRAKSLTKRIAFRFKITTLFII